MVKPLIVASTCPAFEPTRNTVPDVEPWIDVRIRSKQRHRLIHQDILSVSAGVDDHCAAGGNRIDAFLDSRERVATKAGRRAAGGVGICANRGPGPTAIDIDCALRSAG